MFYLHKTDATGPYEYEVVDGQQRLRAVWDFVDGEYALSKDALDIDNTRIANKLFDDLPNRLKNQFNHFQVVIGYTEDARQPAISEVFSRMQMGVRLNPAELRNAIQSGLRHAIDSTARLHPFFHDSRIPPARFKHQDYLAHAISVCYHRGRRDAKAPQLKDDYTNLADSGDYSELLAITNDILDILRDVNDRNQKRITQKWMFVDLFYFLYCNRRNLKSIRAKGQKLSSLYRALDDTRRQHNAEPELLLQGRPTQEDKDLYEYIMAFKYTGGENAHIRQRAKVVARRFGSELGL